MKKYGFTLIETVVSIFILTILFSVGISLSKFARNFTHDMENAAYVYEIQNLYSYAKAVCKEKNKYGKITINTRENKICFVEGWDNIEKTINLPKHITIGVKTESVEIKPYGKIEQGNTIILLDKDGTRQKITIGVGVDLIVINDGGAI